MFELAYINYLLGFLSLVGSSTLGHFSKIHSRERPILSITENCGSKLLGGLLLKEFLGPVISSIKNQKSNERNVDRDELEQCKNTLASRKDGVTPIDAVTQVTRINELKEKIFLFEVEKQLQETIDLTGYFENPDRIADKFIVLCEQVLISYPGNSDQEGNYFSDPKLPSRNTGEADFYNSTKIVDFSQNMQLKNHISSNTIRSLERTFKTMIASDRQNKVAYCKNLLSLLGLSFSEQTAPPNIEPKIEL